MLQVVYSHRGKWFEDDEHTIGEPYTIPNDPIWEPVREYEIIEPSDSFYLSSSIDIPTPVSINTIEQVINPLDYQVVCIKGVSDINPSINS